MNRARSDSVHVRFQAGSRSTPAAVNSNISPCRSREVALESILACYVIAIVPITL